MFNVQCTRCDGTGRYDRGTCFKCKGKRFVKSSRKPHLLPERNYVVTFDTGKKNVVKMYFFTAEYALKAIEPQMLVRGWRGTIGQV